MGFHKKKAFIFFDSLNAICLAKDQVHFIYFEKMVEYVHETYSKDQVDMRENLANMFMKPTLRSKFMHYLDLLNVDFWK